jgi:excinuclease UvrABC ATPase subunit
VVTHPELSLASGAIKGWDRRNQFYFQMLTSLAAHFQFDVDRAFERLPPDVQEVVLYGAKEKIPFSYLNERGKTFVREHDFEGVIPNLERRYKETDSIVVREELAKSVTRPSSRQAPCRCAMRSRSSACSRCPARRDQSPSGSSTRSRRDSPSW